MARASGRVRDLTYSSGCLGVGLRAEGMVHVDAEAITQRSTYWGSR